MNLTNSSPTKVTAKELAKRDFILHGNLWKVVFVIAFPLFIFSFLSYIYSIIDTIMSAGISKAAVNAVGALTQANNMISAIGGGLSAGGSILIAREIGKNNYDKARRLSTSLFAYTILIGGITCAIVLSLATPILRGLNISEESIAVGFNYFIVSVISSTVIMINTVYMGVEKARGSTLPISLLNVGVVLVKVSLNMLFLYGLHLTDMMFVSLSTLIANLCLLVFVICRLASRKYLFHFRFKDIDFSGKLFGKTTAMSFPIFLGKFIFSLGKVVINALAGNYENPDVIGALGVSNNMGGSVTNPISSIEDSTSSVISQNLGAKQVDRAIKTFYVGLVYALGIASVGVIIVSVFIHPITLFFARNAGSPEEVEAFAKEIEQVFVYERLGIITLAINSAVLGMLYGFGYTSLASAINIARVFVFRVPIFLILEYGVKDTNGNPLDGFTVSGLSMGISNILIGVVAIVVAVCVIIHVTKKSHIKEANMSLSEEERRAIDGYISQSLAAFKPYKGGRWCYEDGVYLNGVLSLYQATKKPEYLDFCRTYFETHIGADGTLEGYDPTSLSLDDLEAGDTLVRLNKIASEPQFDKAIAILMKQVASQPRLPNGSFFHKQKYPNEVWLDGLFMACPFYARANHSRPRIKGYQDVVSQFTNVEKDNRDPKTGFYYHAYDANKAMPWADKESGRSPNVWLRSVGWLAMADCDVYEILKGNQAKLLAAPLERQLKHVLDSLKPYEDPKTHLYNDLPTVKDVQGNYPETSGSLMVSYGYLKGARIGMLDYHSVKAGISIFEGVVRQCLKEGSLGSICLVSGLDGKTRNGSVSYYLSEPIVKDDAKGVGPFFMAYSEYLSQMY